MSLFGHSQKVEKTGILEKKPDILILLSNSCQEILFIDFSALQNFKIKNKYIPRYKF